MPYFVSSIIAIVSAFVVLFTRYEGDNSVVISELEKVKKMILVVDSYVDTYLSAGYSINTLDAKALRNGGLLLDGSCVNNSNTLYFPHKNLTVDASCSGNSGLVAFQLKKSPTGFSSYDLYIGVSSVSAFANSKKLAENYIKKEVCEKTLLGKANLNVTELTLSAAAFGTGGNDHDGKVLCTISK